MSLVTYAALPGLRLALPTEEKRPFFACKVDFILQKHENQVHVAQSFFQNFFFCLNKDASWRHIRIGADLHLHHFSVLEAPEIFVLEAHFEGLKQRHFLQVRVQVVVLGHHQVQVLVLQKIRVVNALVSPPFLCVSSAHQITPARTARGSSSAAGKSC